LVGGYLVEDIQNHGNDLNLAYNFLNGRPTSLTESLRVYTQSDRVRYDAIYGQDQWTLGRITLQGALRFDHAWSYSPPQTISPTLINGQQFPSTAISFGRADGVNYKDISPRGGFAWDVRGNGKTAVKINAGRYEDPASNLNNNYSISNPLARIATSSSNGPVARTWNDANGDFKPQCDFTNNLANGECGASPQAAFGTPTFITAAIDPALINGWGIRPNDWQFGASVQQQLAPRISVEIGYFKRWLQNFTATDNLAVTSADFTAFSINAPSDPRLPNGGNYSVGTLYNVVPSKFGQTSNNITDAGNFGKQYQSYNGFLINFSARAASGLTLTGGINTGRTVTDNCDIRTALPELAPTTAFCHNDPGFITKANAIASYTIPHVDVLIAGTFRSDQGAPLQANWNVPTATVVNPALGRTISGGAATLAVNILEPGKVWGDRVNELDLRFAKILHFGRMRVNAGIDVYNIINSNAILTYNQTFTPNGAWLAPTSVLSPRFMKVSAQIDF
ncbi:MAG TPA: hypothetical protein VN628_16555, partial [Vicinamibacterales bacterium]|nr:hypothetical protein [Vicinamibacterales bacterium]